MKKMMALGLDAGTTSLSAAVVDLEKQCLAAAFTILSESTLPGKMPYEKMQDGEKILSGLEKLLSEALSRFDLSVIALTGQMHGIVYVDKAGKIVSPLYTWQDGRAGAADETGESVCRRIRAKTGWEIPPGYGWATHIALQEKGEIPANAATLCTVMDAAVMRLTGRKRPLLHASNAASLGFFDFETGDFDREALGKMGVSPSFIPEICQGEEIAGYYESIPVLCTVGDNQASVFGALRDEKTDVLLNFGTGSQVSLVTEERTSIPGLEIRPYVQGKYLLSGAALCGGRAYALLEGFFRAYAKEICPDAGEQYAIMNRLALETEGAAWQVQPLFCGTRQDASIRGSMAGIGEENFTPGHLIRGLLQGMAGELYVLYEKMPGEGRSRLVASGNGVRKNPALQRALADRFSLPLFLPSHREEAAFGAALLGAAALGMEKVKYCIAYEEAQ